MHSNFTEAGVRGCQCIVGVPRVGVPERGSRRGAIPPGGDNPTLGSGGGVGGGALFGQFFVTTWAFLAPKARFWLM